MKIHVKGYLTLKTLVGDRVVQVDEAGGLTLRGLLAILSAETGEDLGQGALDGGKGVIGPHVAILVNGSHASHLPYHLDTALQDGDEVSIFLPIAGG